MRTAIKGLEWLVEQMGGLARFCVLVLVLLVATNVILRYLFSIGPVSLHCPAGAGLLDETSSGRQDRFPLRTLFSSRPGCR